MKKNKEKEKYVDDGHTIFSMADIDKHRGDSNKGKVLLTTKERIALMKAAICYFFPRFLLVIFCFVIALVLIYFWLK